MALDFPLQFRRQYSGPLDEDSVFETTALRNAYLTNARRHGGQPVVDLEEGKMYIINAAKNAYIPVGSDNTLHDVELLTYGALLLYSTTSLTDGAKMFVWDASADPINNVVGWAYYRYDKQTDNYTLLSKSNNIAPDLTNYYTKAEVNSAISAASSSGHKITNSSNVDSVSRARLKFLNATIVDNASNNSTDVTVVMNTDAVAESGTPTNKWFTESRVRATVLTGLSVASNAVVGAADSILTSIGKLQAQVSSLATAVSAITVSQVKNFQITSDLDTWDTHTIKGIMTAATFSFFNGLTASDFRFESAADAATPSFTDHGTGSAGQTACEGVLRAKTSGHTTQIRLTCITGKTGEVELNFKA
jgi:hypothetical protein